MKTAVAALLTLAFAGSALAQAPAQPAAPANGDRPATAEERTRVLAALAAVGCRDPRSIEREDDGEFDVENARCADGVYDVELDAQYRITDRDRED